MINDVTISQAKNVLIRQLRMIKDYNTVRTYLKTALDDCYALEVHTISNYHKYLTTNH